MSFCSNLRPSNIVIHSQHIKIPHLEKNLNLVATSSPFVYSLNATDPWLNLLVPSNKINRLFVVKIFMVHTLLELIFVALLFQLFLSHYFD